MGDPPTSQQSKMPSLLKKSYSSATSNIFPGKDLGILIEAADGIKLKEYVAGIGKIIDKSVIRCASRISNNRICLFLSSQEIVKYVTEKHSTVEISQHQLELRSLIKPLKRIVLSNVSLVIPHKILKEEFE